MDYSHRPLRSSTGSLPMRAPVAQQVSRKYKTHKAAVRKIDREMKLGRLKSVRKATDGVVITFYMSRRSSDWHKWAWDNKVAQAVKKQVEKVTRILYLSDGTEIKVNNFALVKVS